VGTPLFAIMGGASELAWLTYDNAEQQVFRRLASDVFSDRFAGSPILATIPLFTFVGYVLAESKTPERLVRAAEHRLGVGVRAAEHRDDDAALLLEQAGEEVKRVHLRVALCRRQLLRRGERLLGLDREAVCLHPITPPAAAP
jgi:hypothetical protein